ncbi:aminotransferase class V-fold PLP-dependent enzyme [Microbacterium proteolyticum]|uniref:aminotransferase class V-fold PLP-dependent enzyme n=1 Tax=Microbacterium proteolyticum TaxID=1572644 RepID=UPI001FAD4717|nr:aminotransferase class V-fold PLP-dependent enzyme [Microbacterium proteolyticum]MCI9856658.1 aminotransferase class V-fold PLP-dependent enzyme [Microbacterium proteolyticum]
MSTLASHFTGGRDYLAACTLGLPTRGTVRAVRADLDAAASGRPDIAAASRAVEDARSAYARLVHSPVGDVAIASQTSVMVSLIAASLPDGAEVLCPEGDFSSLVAPFAHAGRGIRLRTAPLAHLADAVTSDTSLVAFSLVQSATGEVADAAGIAAAATRAGARTLCDLTQAAGWLPVDATLFDATVCHAYKWLCCPRGVGFLTVTPSFAATLLPVQAGWYSGDDPWASCYGTGGTLASDARRFDVSPAWQAFVGAAPALEMFADAAITELHAHATGLAARFRAGLGLAHPTRPSAIVTWPDATGEALARLTAHGITASGRAGRARVAFHVFNDDADVNRALEALGAGGAVGARGASGGLGAGRAHAAEGAGDVVGVLHLSGAEGTVAPDSAHRVGALSYSI